MRRPNFPVELFERGDELENEFHPIKRQVLAITDKSALLSSDDSLRPGLVVAEDGPGWWCHAFERRQPVFREELQAQALRAARQPPSNDSASENEVHQVPHVAVVVIGYDSVFRLAVDAL